MTYKRAHRVPWRLVEDKAVLVSVKNSQVMVLNQVGTEIWNYLEQGKSSDEIVDHILSVFDVDRETAEKDVREFLADMQQRETLDVL
ncbi:MAG: PqqD family peptide modification chaperone [Candidatus Omnitrophica bacterium]|nr:PqqD family peptide modification chaperone [Candidatus Omnitrophota bacterium]